MFYYLYEIRNNLNGKIYVGVHKTKNLDDDYMGSGLAIKRAINKYGVEHFSKVILEMFPDEQSMFLRETNLVNKEFILRSDTYNIRPGGRGGFTVDAVKKGRKRADEQLLEKFGPEFRTIISSLGAQTAKKMKVGIFSESYVPRGFSDSNRDSAKSAESIAKRKETFSVIQHQQGENNSQFGSSWITDGTVNKKVKRESIIPEGWRKGRTLR